MCRRRSCRHFLLLLLILTASLSSVTSQDEEVEIAEVEAEVEADVEAEEPNSEETTTAAAAAADAEETEVQLNAEKCESPPQTIKAKCCKFLFDIDDAFIKCMMLHQKKMPKKADQNPVALIKFFSCLIECVFKTKKFMTKDDKINMKMVKADAKKQYKDKPKQRDYMIAQYEHCERHATLEWAKIKKNPGARVLFNGACKPYYMFVFLCTTEYGKISCPHFKWTNSKEFKEECKSLKEKCETLVE